MIVAQIRTEPAQGDGVFLRLRQKTRRVPEGITPIGKPEIVQHTSIDRAHARAAPALNKNGGTRREAIRLFKNTLALREGIGAMAHAEKIQIAVYVRLCALSELAI